MPQGSSAVRPTNGLYIYLYLLIRLVLPSCLCLSVCHLYEMCVLWADISKTYYQRLSRIYRFQFLAADYSMTGAMHTSNLVMIYPNLMNGTGMIRGLRVA